MQVIECSNSQGGAQKDDLKFSETTEWMVEKFKNTRQIRKFGKIAINPMKSYDNVKKIYNDFPKIKKEGRAAYEIVSASNAWTKESKANMLQDVISKLGDE